MYLASMTLENVRTDVAAWEAAMEIYFEAFPEEERRTVDNIVGLLAGEPRYTFMVAEVDGAVAGMVTTWTFGRFVYVEHLAVDHQLRGCNIGSGIVSALTGKLGLPVILEVELPDENGITTAQKQQREARLRFYRRLGFRECALPYIQPSYKAGEPATLPLMLMEYGGRLLPDEFEMVRDTIHREVYGVK